MDAPSVLVVDDDPMLRRLLDLGLQRAGFVVRLASDGKEAVESYRRQPPGIVLMDVQMPGADGAETLALLREFDPHLRCCLMTGGTSYSTEELLKMGALRVIEKPFNLERLAQTLRQALARPQAA
jgi:DNA-binding NtrC family response regulator